MDNSKLSDEAIDQISLYRGKGRGDQRDPSHRHEFYYVGVYGETTAQDILEVGDKVCVIAVNYDCDEIVLLRRFRLGGHLAGKGSMVELPAGSIDGSHGAEEMEDDARRICQEQIGVVPHPIVWIFDVVPSPGISDEHVWFYIGIVDTSNLPRSESDNYNLESEHPLCISIDRALEALAAGGLRCGFTVMALQWLALNRGRLREIVGSSTKEVDR